MHFANRIPFYRKGKLGKNSLVIFYKETKVEKLFQVCFYTSYLSISLSIHPAIHRVCLSVRPSVNPFVCLSIQPWSNTPEPVEQGL